MGGCLVCKSERKFVIRKNDNQNEIFDRIIILENDLMNFLSNNKNNTDFSLYLEKVACSHCGIMYDTSVFSQYFK